MGDGRRFHLFGALIARNLDARMRIADVAAGKGYLRANLHERGFHDVTSWDRRPRQAKDRSGYRYGWFDFRTAPDYDAVVAMHPDEGTDHTILYAGARRVPAIICPCCAKGSAVPYWGARNGHAAWMRHLTELAQAQYMDVTHTALPMTGRNEVLILRPRKDRRLC